MAGNEKVNHIGRKEEALEKIIGPAGPEKIIHLVFSGWKERSDLKTLLQLLETLW